MMYKLGESGLTYKTIEGHIARAVYDRKEGESVFRRITPIAQILTWAGVCKPIKGKLALA
ncbi:MAG: hypothetical protein HY840_12465 [Bacteroidetes bacterium]|nr:hypothetical protein [Bacteroidota bacterium]